MKLASKVTKDGFTITTKLAANPDASNTSYHAPAHVSIEIGNKGALQTLELYASPSRPGFCNHVGRMVSAACCLMQHTARKMTFLTSFYLASLS
jgi:hypothetical protein